MATSLKERRDSGAFAHAVRRFRESRPRGQRRNSLSVRRRNAEAAFAHPTDHRPPMKLPRQFLKPLAIGAPSPLRELPVRLERMIHFIPPHNEKMRAKAGEIATQVDVVLGNLEDAIPIEAKRAAREGFIAMARETDFG